MKKLLKFLGFAVGILLLFILVKTLMFSSVQMDVEPVQAIEVRTEAAENLAAAIRLKTISYQDPAAMDSVEFNAFKDLLKDRYPLVDSLLELRVFNELGLLYKWQGSSSADPMIFMGHYDVVPVPLENRPQWTEDPFSGLIKDGVVWGRGAIDDKFAVIGIMEAVEALLAADFRPARTIYLAFGHDEEIGGHRGAETISNWLKAQGVTAAMVLDEGYAVTEDLIPGMEGQVAIIGTAEKGYLSMRLSVETRGGHSSVPPAETSIGLMAGAVEELLESPFKPELSEPLKGFMRNLGPEMPFLNKMAFANPGIFKSMIFNIYSESAEGNALIRTTTAPTIFNAGLKDNVIPGGASCTINFRILPGTTDEDVITHVKQRIDEKIEIEVIAYDPPSPVSISDDATYAVLNTTVKEIFNNLPTSPNLVLGATDARYFHQLSDHVYRFLPNVLTPEVVPTFHGINEKVPVSEFENGIRFYTQLIRNMNEAD